MNARSAQNYARVAGFLLFITMICGFFGEMYVPEHLIARGDAAATAANVLANDTLFRLGFAAYLIEAICDVTLALLLYALLRPVQQDVALLSAFFGLLSTALFAVAEFFYFATSLVLRTFAGSQRDAFALFSLKAYGLGAGLFFAFYGIATLLRGILIYRSRYLPRIIGVLFVIAGIGFIAKNFLLVLAPRYASDALLLLMAPAVLLLMVWLLVKGVDAEKWNALTS